MIDLLRLAIFIAEQTNVTSNAPQTGGSSIPIVAAVLSAVLTFVGGIVTQRYVLQKQGQQKRFEAMEKSIKENREYVYKELLPRLTENFATFQSYEVAVQNWKPVVDDLKELQRITKIIGDYDEQLAQEIVNTWNSRAEIVKSGDFGTREETYTRLVPDWSGDIEAVEEGSGVAGQTAGIRELPITAAGKWCDGVVSSRHG